MPDSPFMGNEVEKRNLMFDLARPSAAPDDWFLIIDSDEVITMASHDLKAQIESVEEDVACYGLQDGDTLNHVRGLYRNTPDLHIEDTHYGYSNDSRSLWDYDEPTGELSSYLVLEHKQRDRQSPRAQAKWEYYKNRDRLGAEQPKVAA